jgi:hypothetical protein
MSQIEKPAIKPLDQKGIQKKKKAFCRDRTGGRCVATICLLKLLAQRSAD